MNKLNQTLVEHDPKEDKTVAKPDIKEDLVDISGFPCDRCEKIFPKKLARALHLSKFHNIKTINYTPGIVRQNSKKRMETRQSLKCNLCSFISKTKPNMKKHVDVYHKKMSEKLQEVKKRQHVSYTCPECNSTFDSKYKLGKHLKEQHQGKVLSPDRKVAKMNHNEAKEEDVEGDNINLEEKKKELENLQDLLVQTGKEKEELGLRLVNCNTKLLTLEKANEKQTQEINYLKVENEKSKNNLNDLDKEHITQIKGLKTTETQNEQDIKYLKSENEKCNRDLNAIESTYKTQVIELKKVVDQKDIEIKILNDQLSKLKTSNIVIVNEEEAVKDTVEDAANHVGTYTTKCRECDFVGGSQYELDEHHRNDCSEALIQQLVEEDNGFVCQICGMDFSGRTQNEWEEHRRNNCPGFVCPICGLTRNTKNNIEKHMEYHDNDEEDIDWSNEEDSESEEGQVAVGNINPQEVTGESEEAWNRVQRTGSRYKCPTCRVT